MSAPPLGTGSRIHLHYGLNTASLRNLTARLSSPTDKYLAFMPYGHGVWSTVVTLPKSFSWKVQKHTESVKNAAGAFSESIDPLSPEQLQVQYHMELAHMVYSPEQYPDLYKLVSEAYAVIQEG